MSKTTQCETYREGSRIFTKCETCEKIPWATEAIRRCLCHGFNLDLGCGSHKQSGFVGLDQRDITNVDIVWNIESVVSTCKCTAPQKWPFLDNSVDRLLCSHVLEHMKPWGMLEIMAEMWRICKPDSQVLIAVPYAGSFGFWQDPTHTKGYNQATWEYFDPSKELYGVYQPLPWKIDNCNWNPHYNMEVVMHPIKSIQKPIKQKETIRAKKK